MSSVIAGIICPNHHVTSINSGRANLDGADSASIWEINRGGKRDSGSVEALLRLGRGGALRKAGNDSFAKAEMALVERPTNDDSDHATADAGGSACNFSAAQY